MKSVVKNMIVRLSQSKIRNTPYPVFLKHGVIEKPGLLFKKNYDNIEPEAFYAQVKFLKKYYDIIPLQEAIHLAQAGKSLTGKCSITFDDAYASVKNNAFPVLESLKAPATIFVISDVIDDKNMFWRDQVRHISLAKLENDFIAFWKQKYSHNIENSQQNLYKLSKSEASGVSKTMQEALKAYFQENKLALNADDQTNCDTIFMQSKDIQNAPDIIDFGNHTASHPNLCSLKIDEQSDEINRCHLFLKKLNANSVPILSLPFGASNNDTIKAAKNLGYNDVVHHSNVGRNDSAFATSGHIDRYTLPITNTDLGWLLLQK